MMLTSLLTINIVLVTAAILLIIAERFLADYGECSVVINKEKEIKVRGGGTLLEYFTNNHIFIPSACGGKATCGHCKVKVLSGAGSILPTEEVYISPKEKTAGIRLACQVKVRNDVEVWIPEHIFNTRKYKAEVVHIDDLTCDIKRIRFKLMEPSEINFRPGQYIQIQVPGTEEFRAYSIASDSSDKDMVELMIRHVPGGLCSTYVHRAAEIGETMSFTGPFGDFYLNENSSKSIICIGGGCGMAPIMSILLHLAARGMPRKVIFFFGARSKKDLFMTEELRALEKKYPNFRYVPSLSEPSSQDKWDGEVGLVTQVMEKYIEDASEFEVYMAGRQDGITALEAYMCGPPPMIEAALKVLMKKGMKETDIFYDKF